MVLQALFPACLLKVENESAPGKLHFEATLHRPKKKLSFLIGDW